MVRRAITVHGVVQGVGFRPFVHAAATARGLAGWVRNRTDGVRIEVEGPAPAVEACAPTIPATAARHFFSDGPRYFSSM